jgi:hypothetical protein
VANTSGGLFGSWTLSEEYGFSDVDSRRPNLGEYWKENFPHLPEPGSATGKEWVVRDCQK